ncbi:hypothetical protein OB13_10630 [Pontibacter sp. HJ8]
MKTKLIPVMLALLLVPLLGQATHIYSGYISYTADPQNPRKFDFVFTLYTTRSSPADDPFVMVDMGDGSTVRVDRDKVFPYSSRYDQETFTWSYTYAALGNYIVTWTGENRNGGIINVAAPSDQLSFQVYTQVRAGTLTQNLDGAKLAGVPLTVAYTSEPWTHNLLAYDADGDYLVYELVPPKYRSPSGFSVNVPGFWTPQGLTVTEFGELRWENPGMKGEYIIALRVIEMRNGREIGSMVVDISFQVDERIDQPVLSLLNKDRLTVNDDGSIQTWPGQPVKLEFYLRESPGSDLPLSARAFGELDTLNLLEASLAFRDTLDGFAITYTFTPTPELERMEPYLIGIRGRHLEDKSLNQHYLKIEDDWAFAYLHVGEQRRPLSSDDFIAGKIRLYPNPASDRFVLEAPELPALYLQLRDVTGRVVTSYTLRPGPNALPRPAALSSGLYLYTLTSRNKPVSSGKLVLQ